MKIFYLVNRCQFLTIVLRQHAHECRLKLAEFALYNGVLSTFLHQSQQPDTSRLSNRMYVSIGPLGLKFDKERKEKKLRKKDCATCIY